MQNEVIILTEAGNKFGYGNLTRCLAIAQGFREKGLDSLFNLRGDSSPDTILKDFTWYSTDWLNEELEISGKIVIVDSYYADENFCRKIYHKAKTVLFIDDYNRIPYPGGFVLNSVIGAEKIAYPVNPEITYLLGPKFHPLRKEFWKVPVKEIREKVLRILITFGGTDVTNETPGVLKILKECYSEIEKHVIIGNGFTNIDEIKAVADKKTILVFQPDAKQMKQEMLESDIAISAAGQTIYELARVGVATFAKRVVKNQDININNWMTSEFLLNFNSLNKIPDYNCRNNLYQIGRKTIDGQGVHRIIGILINDQS